MTEGLIQISENIYWIGTAASKSCFYCHSYLLIEGNDALLIDPGSALNFKQVYVNLSKICSLDKIRYIILHHQDPDICSSLVFFKKLGLNCPICTDWRSSLMIEHYGAELPFYIINENQYELELSSGRRIDFIPSPHLHTAGSFMSYDSKTGVLFSSDLFGAYSANWTLFADENYKEGMKVFHEHFMPPGAGLLELSRKLHSLNIDLIAPQHGSIIKDNVNEFIDILPDIENSYQKSTLIQDSKMAPQQVYHKILQRLSSLFSEETVLGIFADTEIQIDKKNMTIQQNNKNQVELWELLFEILYSKKGIDWLMVLSGQIESWSKEADLPLPSVIKSKLYESELRIRELDQENEKLRLSNVRLQDNLARSQDALSRCPITLFLKENVLEDFLQREIKNAQLNQSDFFLLAISIDQFEEINNHYGRQAGDESLARLAYLLRNEKNDAEVFFKSKGISIFLYSPLAVNADQVEQRAEQIRQLIQEDRAFLLPVQVSIGGCLFSQSNIEQEDLTKAALFLMNQCLERMRVARAKGGGQLCLRANQDGDKLWKKTVLIAENDRTSLEVLSSLFLDSEVDLLQALDGEEAFSLLQENNVDLLISELSLPKMDAFTLKRNMLMQSNLKNIPMVLLSHIKNEDSIQRAFYLDILHYLRKPFMVSEIKGLAKMLLKMG